MFKTLNVQAFLRIHITLSNCHLQVMPANVYTLYFNQDHSVKFLSKLYSEKGVTKGTHTVFVARAISRKL